jgi:hypothetical protein
MKESSSIGKMKRKEISKRSYRKRNGESMAKSSNRMAKMKMAKENGSKLNERWRRRK